MTSGEAVAVFVSSQDGAGLVSLAALPQGHTYRRGEVLGLSIAGSAQRPFPCSTVGSTIKKDPCVSKHRLDHNHVSGWVWSSVTAGQDLRSVAVSGLVQEEQLKGWLYSPPGVLLHTRFLFSNRDLSSDGSDGCAMPL